MMKINSIRLFVDVVFVNIGSSKRTTFLWDKENSSERVYLMEITSIPFDKQLVIFKNKQKIIINIFLTSEHGNIKMGIVAPKGISVDREEIYVRKQKKIQDMLNTSNENE